MEDGPDRAAPQRRRFRESECRDPALIAAAAGARHLARLNVVLLLGLLALLTPASTLAAGPSFSLWATFGGGHDDQVLAEPERRGIIEAVADQFATASGRFQVGWTPEPGRDRLTLNLEAGATHYGTEAVGSDSDLRLSGSYRRRLSHSLAVDGYGAWWRFRRSALNDFNVDMNRLTGRFAWSPSPPWLASVSGRLNWFRFPDRPLYVDTTSAGGDGEVIVIPLGDETEQDHQKDLSLSILRRLGRAAYVSVEGGYRWSGSNELSVRFTGPQATLRVGRSLPGDLDIVGYAGFLKRRFDPYEAVQAGAEASSLQNRRDEAWQFGFSLERPLRPGVRFIADGSWLSQDSNLDLFQFDHARVSVALSVELWSHGRSRPGVLRAADDPPPLAPTVTPEGVWFRVRAPGAREVQLVGDFNAWTVGRTPLVPTRDGVWEVFLPLPSGIWRYAFVVDGEWRRPQDAPRYESDGFGGENGVLEVADSGGSVAVTAPRGERPTLEAAGEDRDLP